MTTDSPGIFTNQSEVQAFMSSDGNAVLFGTVQQNLHILANSSSATTDPSVSLYHQYAHYYIISGLQFTDNYSTDLAGQLSQQGYLVNLEYAPAITQDGSYSLTFCKNIVSNTVDLNAFANGNVPIPTTGQNGSQGLWYPNATVRDADQGGGYTQFNPIFNFNWEGDSGYVEDVQVSYSDGCQYNFNAQKTTAGNQNFTWYASPNYAVFNYFRFSLNNSYNTATKTTEYNADLITSFVNGYLVYTTNINWQEEFYFEVDTTLSGQNCDCAGEKYSYAYAYNESLNYDYTWVYDEDFIYKLHYYAQPDVWLTNATVTPTTVNPSWVKHQTVPIYYEIPAGPSYCSPGYNTPGDTNTWDAYCFETPIIKNAQDPPGDCYIGPVDEISFQASQFAYATTNTLGPPFSSPASGYLPLYADNGYGPGGIAEFTFYSGIVKKGVFDVQGGGSWPGYYLAYYSGSAEYNWVDLNYDQLFYNSSPDYWAIYAGRSSMVLNGLYDNSTVGNNSSPATPTVYGIVTQLLGDGTDYNNIYSSFKGRMYDPSNSNTNTAFVYKQNYDGIYHYSAPWLFLGDLSGLQNNTTGFNLGSTSGNNNAFGQAIGQLADYASLMDAYGNTLAENNCNNLAQAIQAGMTNPLIIPIGSSYK